MSDSQAEFARRISARLLVSLRTRIDTAHPDHRVIFTGMFSVIAFLLIGKTAGAGKEMAIAYQYGVGIELDAYLLVLNWINVLIGVWLAALGTALVPLWARAQHMKESGLPAFRAELLGFSMLFGLGLGLVGWAALPFLLRAPWLALPPELAAMAEDMVPQLMLVTPFGIVGGLLATWMLAAGRHVGTLLEGVQPLVIALGITLLAAPARGIEVLAWSTVAGSAAYLACLAWALARQRELGAPRLSHRSPHWQVLWNGLGVVVVGQALMNSITIVDQLFAVRIGSGAVAMLSYSDRITLLLLNLGGVAIARATLPVFSRTQAEGRDVARKVVAPWVVTMFIAGSGTTLLAWLAAPWLVALLFERGAFTAQDTLAVTALFRSGVAQFPFYFAGLVLISKLLSLGLRRWVAMLAIGLFCIKVLANMLLVRAFGLNGIIMATVAMYVASFAVLVVLAVRADRTGRS